MYSSQSTLAEKRRLFCFSLPNIVLMVIATFMTTYSFLDQPKSELKFIADAYSDVGKAPLYLRQFGFFAFFICGTTIFAFFISSLLVHFVFSTLIVALIVIQMHAAVLVFGDARTNSIKLKLKLQSLMDETVFVSATDYLLVDEIQLSLDCCGSTKGFSWPQGKFPDRSGTCCPFVVLDPATNQCPFELSKLIPCDKAAVSWVKFRVWKYFGILFLCAFFEAAALILVLPAIFIIKQSPRKRKSR